VSHLVSYRDSDGKQSYHETVELNDAIAYVEHLRNDEAVDHARIFKMDEVSFEFRPYFRVEIAETAPAAPPPPPADWVPPQPVDEPAPADDERDPLAAAWAASERPEEHLEDSVGAGMGRRGLFGR
jgi:hypothetical protein